MKSTCIKVKITMNKTGAYGLLIIEEGKTAHIDNITNDFMALKILSDKINRGRVSRLHIYDIIEDFLE